jgi:uridine kinase
VPTVHTYEFHEVDVILLEGIFLLKRELRPLYDLAFWLDCRFDVALGRTIARNQEGLSQAEIIHDYTTLYFPAQRLHFERDHPRAVADLVLSAHS